jgi:hypothetical protein
MMDGAHHVARPDRRWWEGHGERLTLVVAMTAIGLTLILQPDRYANTPSYANLLDVFPAWVWGLLYVLVAAAVLGGIRGRTHSVVIHTAAVALISAWDAAFVIRYLTDGGTTIVNVVSWSVFLTLVIRSALKDQGGL